MIPATVPTLYLYEKLPDWAGPFRQSGITAAARAATLPNSLFNIVESGYERLSSNVPVPAPEIGDPH